MPYLAVALAVTVVAIIVGLAVLDFLKRDAIPHLSQADVDSGWSQLIDGETSGTNPPNPHFDPTKLCGRMRRISQGDTPIFGNSWPSREVATKYVSLLCHASL